MKRILAVGCGDRKADPDVIRLDVAPAVQPDVLWDLNQFPYPFADRSFTTIECFDVIEHLDQISPVLEEFHRLLQPQGVVQITTPHFSCANSFVDPTHRWHLSYFSFDFFTPSSALAYYSEAKYEMSDRYLYFKGDIISTKLIRRLANRFPKTYEQRWAWMFPAWYLYVELRAIKT